eukprot:CAMPEP_0119041446 /NCGR_PEP_ID=MMETSP1177-20130426/12129_1 /TAXON_ID=2985 /ORGANISM="Ochromonas sp, Strain CCMP1899" /LENGTH=141 /DNA_ID=CAMNT_0007007491 /DNA_START=75 /DNA_END=500 /DNA_ORIENTATION=+
MAVTLMRVFTVALSLALTYAQIPCDEAYGEFCPSESGWEVGNCLKKIGADKLSKECNEYIQLQEVCKDDIEKHCTGKEYSGDLLVCLAEWTKPDLLSPECLASLPKKQEKVEKKLSSKEQQKADKRKKIRNKAAKMARGDL